MLEEKKDDISDNCVLNVKDFDVGAVQTVLGKYVDAGNLILWSRFNSCRKTRFL